MSNRSPVALTIENLRVTLGDSAVLDGASLHLAAGTTLAVIGASGCGKTTLLRAIAGLVPIAAGRITLGSQPVDGLPPHQRGMVYLNQEPLLFPHLNLFDNVAFGLRLRHRPEAEIRARVSELMVLLELDGLERRAPHALSGGQRQRAAFARALIVEPALLLLDEPFSNLDPDTRVSAQTLFKQVARTRGITSMFVTHDLKESLRMGDTFALMRRGQLRLYHDRAAFCGDPDTGVAREAAFWSLVIDAPVAFPSGVSHRRT
ncbi:MULTISPECIES: ABC transporter ATP-binding protein [Rhodanobacter]|uniref:ABC transporter ATP-binding protein n=3 Tax=Rhodanobacteraceae TaxID=1775411 RepID=UPI00090FDC08|nr:ABC transporter ATP-binding protein [Rhodanobacter thiooxydans]TAN16412.1 MAG: ABC transporter ATP-binding protein [Rhodanobacter sp.]UJJ53156.1 ABC transporter ATP-binding protein [Rhodanobacter thiooxydans]